MSSSNDCTPNVHNCKRCDSSNCDIIVCCDWCFEDISEQESEYHYAPKDFEADDEGYVRLCYKCKEDAVLEQISV
jgi:hypothetical protein